MAEYISKKQVYDVSAFLKDDTLRQVIDRIVDTLPPADVKPVVHGKWTLHKNGSATCSECHFWQNSIWDMDRWQNYCGVCGAKMDGVKEKEEET